MSSEKSNYLRPPLHGSGIGDYSLHDFAAKWMMQQDDIAEVRRYAKDNMRIRQMIPEAHRIVMLGDSITEHWQFPTIEGYELINRGIGGQNSSQMLLRFEDDAVSLSPTAVVLLCGTTDLRAYVGDPESVSQSAYERISRNVRAMSDIAKGNGFKLVLCSVPPVDADTDRVARSRSAILQVNAWLKSFAIERKYPFADYFAALADADGNLPARFSEDGIHPNSEAYGHMWTALGPALKKLV